MPEEQKQNVPQSTAPKAAEPTPIADPNDVTNNKVWAILAYIIFFLPLIFAKESKFAIYHAQQGLVLFIVAIIINIIGSVIPILGWFIILPLGNIFILVLALIGIVNSAKGLMKELPLIGQYGKSFKL